MLELMAWLPLLGLCLSPHFCFWRLTDHCFLPQSGGLCAFSLVVCVPSVWWSVCLWAPCCLLMAYFRFQASWLIGGSAALTHTHTHTHTNTHTHKHTDTRIPVGSCSLLVRWGCLALLADLCGRRMVAHEPLEVCSEELLEHLHWHSNNTFVIVIIYCENSSIVSCKWVSLKSIRICYAVI